MDTRHPVLTIPVPSQCSQAVQIISSGSNERVRSRGTIGPAGLSGCPVAFVALKRRRPPVRARENAAESGHGGPCIAASSARCAVCSGGDTTAAEDYCRRGGYSRAWHAPDSRCSPASCYASPVVGADPVFRSRTGHGTLRGSRRFRSVPVPAPVPAPVYACPWHRVLDLT